MARREASNALLRFYREIGYKRYTAWLVHPQAEMSSAAAQAGVKESFLLGLRHVICTLQFSRGTRGTDSCRHCPTVTLVSLQDISFAFNFDFVYPKNGFQTKVYRQGCG